MAEELDVIETMIDQEQCAYKTEEGVLAAVLLANRNYGLIDKDKLYTLFARRDINGGSRSFITFVLNNAFLETPGVWKFPYPPSVSFWLTLYGAIKRYKYNWDKIRNLFDRAIDGSERRFQTLYQGARVTINGLEARLEDTLEETSKKIAELERAHTQDTTDKFDLIDDLKRFKLRVKELLGANKILAENAMTSFSDLITNMQKSINEIDVVAYKDKEEKEDDDDENEGGNTNSLNAT